MSGRISKKIRQVCRRNWREYYGDIISLPLHNRLGIAWFIVTHHKKGINDN